MTKWEYTTLTNPSQDYLNAMGYEGWELVGVTSFETGGSVSLGGVGSGKYEVSFAYVFKRPRAENSNTKSPLYSGQKDLSDLDYQAFLVGAYGIRRHEVLDGFTVLDKCVKDLGRALEIAHKRQAIVEYEYITAHNERTLSKYMEDYPTGYLIQTVSAGEGAEKAGLLPGDFLLSYDRRSVKQSNDLSLAIEKATSPKVALVVMRGDSIKTLEADKGRLGITAIAVKLDPSQEKLRMAWLGIHLLEVEQIAT